VGTKGFTDEQAAKQMLYKGAFAIGNPKGDAFYNPFDFDVKNVANTGVVDWGGELYALWEGGKPHKMDPTTLRTEGEADSVLGHDLEVPQMAAHYRVLDADDPAKKRLVAFSIEAQNQPLQPNKCCFYEWDADGKPAARAPFGVQNATFGMFHDCLVTENWYMLLQNPTALDPRKLLTEYMFAKCALAEVIGFQDGKSATLHMLPRTEKARAIGQKAIPVDNQFFFHHVNAFEPEGSDGSRVVVDSAPWKFMDFSMNLDMVTPAFYNGGSRVEYTRFDIDVANETSKQASLSNRVMEFPQVNHAFTGKPYRYTYAAAAAVKDDVLWGPNQCLVKFDCDPSVGAAAKETVWYFGERSFMQEPIFCPKPGGRRRTTDGSPWWSTTRAWTSPCCTSLTPRRSKTGRWRASSSRTTCPRACTGTGPRSCTSECGDGREKQNSL
jgi:all-trans-8'-apo-beta-carotenal 15,15'-oxygenase